MKLSPIKKVNCVIVMMSFCISVLQAQDQNFSQFFAAPLNLNPALAGSYDGSFRVGAIYRDQWRAVSESTVATYGVGGDLRYANPFTNEKNPDYAALGFQFYGDRVSTYDLNTNQISIFLAYHKALDRRTRQYLSLGLNLGIAQRNINYEDLIFDDQFNNIDAFDLTTSESLPVNNFAYGDYGIGLHYTVTPSTFFNLNTGVALAHFHTPNISFYRSNDDVNPDLERQNNLFAKWTVYVNTDVKLNELISLSPRALFINQGPHNQINFGTGARLGRFSSDTQAFHLGAFLRLVRDESTYTPDGLVVMTGFEYSNMLIGLSYDIGLRDLVSDKQGVGAFELSITYIGEYENDFNFCPKF